MPPADASLSFRSRRPLIVAMILASMVLLIPGLVLPVLTIRGVLTRDGIAHVAPLMLEKGLDERTIAALTKMINPAILGFLQATGGDLRKMLIEKLSPEVTASLQKSAEDVEVYSQTRSILGAVRNLYQVGSPLPATLILLFSVIVPFGKAGLVACSMFMSGAWRRRTLGFVESIAKWSMADVFVVAMFIVYLAAHATQTPPGEAGAAPSLVQFTAAFGPGFYWFAGYCLFSLASQQITARLARTAE